MSLPHVAKHELLGLTDEQALKMYTFMLTARKFDERATLLQRSGKSAFHISGIGHEAAQVAAAFALHKQHDYFLPYYRDYAFVLSVGMTVRELMLAALFKAEDVNGGRQMPGHFGSRKHHIVTGSSPVATQVLHAVGIGLMSLMKKEDRVAFVTFGEGSSNQGDVHEGFNFAGVFKLPVIFMCENNQYAISIPAHRQVADRVVDRAAGYGPTLIEAMMYRIAPHSTADDDMLYRTKEEVDYYKEQDGIERFRRYLFDCGVLNEELDRTVGETIAGEVSEATKYADKRACGRSRKFSLRILCFRRRTKSSARRPKSATARITTGIVRSSSALLTGRPAAAVRDDDPNRSIIRPS